MKKVVIRENIRSIKVANGQLKSTHSQSPPQKTIIKKLQLKHTDPINKSDYSLQDKLVFQEPKPGASDFRGEIERRYNNSGPNSVYIFPRKQGTYKDSIDSQTSINTSIDSLRHVTVYDLTSQNNKTRRQDKAYDTVAIQISPREYELKASKAKNDKKYLHMVTDSYENEHTDNSEMCQRSETRYKDKTQQSYKRLLNLLDKQRYVSPNATKRINHSYQQNHSQEQLFNFIPMNQGNKIHIKHQTMKSKLSERTLQAIAAYSTYNNSQIKDSKSKSQEKRSEYNSLRRLDDNVNLSGTYSKGFNKTLTRENFIPFIDTSNGINKNTKNNISFSTKAYRNFILLVLIFE